MHDSQAVAAVLEPYSLRQRIADNLFWTLFVKDRIYNFHAGLPFAVHPASATVAAPVCPHIQYCNAMILTKVCQGNPSSFLRVIVQYYQLFNDVATVVSSTVSSSVSLEQKLEQLDSRLCLWQASLPYELRLHASLESIPENVHFVPGQGCLLRQRIALFLRFNFLRTVINRHLVIHSQQLSSIAKHGVQKTLELCCTTISLLLHLNKNLADLYRGQRAIFTHFLNKAITTMSDVSSLPPVQLYPHEVLSHALLLTTNAPSSFGHPLDLKQGDLCPTSTAQLRYGWDEKTSAASLGLPGAPGCPTQPCNSTEARSNDCIDNLGGANDASFELYS